MHTPYALICSLLAGIVVFAEALTDRLSAPDRRTVRELALPFEGGFSILRP